MTTNEKRKRSEWNDPATSALIQLWAEHLDDLRRVKRNRHVYQDMSKKLLDMHGIEKTMDEIKNKMDSLTKLYRKEKQKMGSGCSPSSWKFYDSINRILGSLPSQNNELIQESAVVDVQQLEVESLESDSEGQVVLTLRSTPEATSTTGSSCSQPPSKRPRIRTRASDHLQRLAESVELFRNDSNAERAEAKEADDRLFTLIERQTQLQEQAVAGNAQIIQSNSQLVDIFREFVDFQKKHV